MFSCYTGKSAQLEDAFIPASEKVDNYLNGIKMHINEVYEEVCM